MLQRKHGNEGMKVYLVCCSSYYADWKGENKCYKTSEEESPPWQLNLLVQGGAKDKRDCECHSKQEVEPPGRFFIVILLFGHLLSLRHCNSGDGLPHANLAIPPMDICLFHQNWRIMENYQAKPTTGRAFTMIITSLLYSMTIVDNLAYLKMPEQSSCEIMPLNWKNGSILILIVGRA